MLAINIQDPIQRKLESCATRHEAWKTQHEIMQRVFGIEDLLGDLVECYHDLDRLATTYREEVRRFPNDYSEDFDNRLRELHRMFLRVAEGIAKDVLPWCRAQIASRGQLKHEAGF